MAVRLSAGLLPVCRRADGRLEVFLAHFGGPFWAGKENGAWSIVKGEYDPATERPEEAARREWVEEIGAPVPKGRWHDLGTVRQSAAKTVQAFAVLVSDPAEVVFVESNRTSVQWPPRSGHFIEIPEMDRAQWWGLNAARERLVRAQGAYLERVSSAAAEGFPAPGR